MLFDLDGLRSASEIEITVDSPVTDLEERYVSLDRNDWLWQLAEILLDETACVVNRQQAEAELNTVGVLVEKVFHLIDVQLCTRYAVYALDEVIKIVLLWNYCQKTSSSMPNSSMKLMHLETMSGIGLVTMSSETPNTCEKKDEMSDKLSVRLQYPRAANGLNPPLHLFSRVTFEVVFPVWRENVEDCLCR